MANAARRRNPGVTADILDRCHERIDHSMKRFEPEESAKYGEVNNNIKMCMKKAKENWIGEQCSKIEENLTKNNSKRVCQLVRLDYCETVGSYYYHRSLRKMSYRRTRDT